MIGYLGFPAAIATATSQFVLAILSAVGTTTYVLSGGFAGGHGLRRTASLSVGVLVGAQRGQTLADDRRVGRAETPSARSDRGCRQARDFRPILTPTASRPPLTQLPESGTERGSC